MTAAVNRRIILSARPTGATKASDFSIIEEPIAVPGPDQVLLRTIYLSLDPYMRGRMNAIQSYAPYVEIGETMVGGAVSIVEASNRDDFVGGDFVVGYTGWQTHTLHDGAGLRKLDPTLAPISTALGVLGMPGLTAYAGLLDIGQPRDGDTVVVSAASGAVGAVVGQIAKIKGCRVVGIAGAEAKCRYAVDVLGFDECLSHHASDLESQLVKACPQGIDIYFENVGGAVFDAVFGLMNVGSRITVCGMIAHYNDTEIPDAPDRLPRIMRSILTRRIKMQGIIVFDYAHRETDFLADVSQWIRSGNLHYREDIVNGLDNAVTAFQGLFEGRNFGKLLVQVSADPSQNN